MSGLSFTKEQIVMVYDGKENQWGTGKTWHASQYRHIHCKTRNYEVKEEDVSDEQVARVYELFRFHHRRVLSASDSPDCLIFILAVARRWYTVYLVDEVDLVLHKLEMEMQSGT